MEDNSRVARKKREKKQPKRNNWETGLVTLRAFAEISRVTTWLVECWENFQS